MRNRRRRRKTKTQYTKGAVTAILVVALFDLQMPYVLAFLGRENTLEELSKIIVVEIVGVFLVYCLKSYFETKEEHKERRERGIYDEETDE